MNQLAIDFTRARRTDPATSHAAAAGVDRFAHGHFSQILCALKACGPMTIDEIAAASKLDKWAVARRLPELERDGRVAVVVVDGEELTRAGASGRAQRVWRLL